jgi:hypothetical protein
MVYSIKRSYDPKTHQTSLPIRTFLETQRIRNNAASISSPPESPRSIYHYNGSTITFHETIDNQPQDNLFLRLHLGVSSNSKRRTKKTLKKLEKLTLK